MSRASCSILFVLSLCPVAVPAMTGTASATSYVSERREVPLDPLDGIPEEEPNRGKGGRPNGGKSICHVLATPANDRDVADLRATVAIIQHGPKSVVCPGDTSPLRLRISIDPKGQISLVERLSGDKKLGDSLARTLTGRLCQSVVTAPTKGIAQIQFRRGGK